MTVDTVAPTAEVLITAITTDSGTSSNDFITSDTSLTVSGTHGPLGTGERVQVSSDGGANWADVTSSTATTWSFTDPAVHTTSFTYLARVIGGVGNVGANTASQAVTIDTAAPAAPSITSIPENAGGGINGAEAADGTTVVVGLAGTGAVAGDTLTVAWGSQATNYSLTASDISGNSAIVTVPLATMVLQGQGTFNVAARLTDLAGNAQRQLGGNISDGRRHGAGGAGDRQRDRRRGAGDRRGGEQRPLERHHADDRRDGGGGQHGDAVRHRRHDGGWGPAWRRAGRSRSRPRCWARAPMR